MKKLGDSPNEKGYSIWENTNKDLVEKIKKISSKNDIKIGDYVNHWRSKKCKVVSFINDKELLVFSDNHQWHEVYQLEDKEKDLTEDHLQLINNTYKVEDYFFENFGVLYNGFNIVHGLAKRLHNPFREERYNEVSVAGLLIERFDISDYDSLTFESFKAGSSVSCYFDADGNFVNRDYNLDLSSYKPCNPIDVRKNKIDEFINMVSNHISSQVLKYDEDKKTWFTDKFAYELQVNSEEYELGKSIKIFLSKIPNKGKTYYHPGCSRYAYKPSKNSIVVDKSNLIDKLKHILEEYFKQK